ncbi:MAG TPA: hypothetical protein VFI49_05900 [Rudaea sp.]|nr:hypothetical protein [Rudaea sp.]
MLLVAALSVPGKMVLILESNTPLGAVMQIASAPMNAALSHPGR